MVLLRYRAWLLTAVVCIAGCVYSLWPAMKAGAALASPDSPIDFKFAGVTSAFVDFINFVRPTALSHDILFKLAASPETYCDWGYVLSTVLLSMAMFCYLRILGLGNLACAFGALSMAFSGYHFTLFSAGHRGYMASMPYAVFMLALVESAVIAPKWYHFALMAVCAAAAISLQPDIFIIILIFIVLYAVVRSLYSLRIAGGRQPAVRLARGWAAGVAVGLVVFAAFGIPSVNGVLSYARSLRESQIESAVSATGAEEESAEKARWIFATNWSLPVKEAAEIAVPCLRGYDTGNGEVPYWGALGRSWEFPSAGSGAMPNYRQHTIYMGVIQIGLVVFAVISAIMRRGGRSRVTALFWCAAVAAAILLAFGRNAPFYRLFYILPEMDKIRCPVKFLHAAEIGVAVLAAIGMDRLLLCDRSDRKDAAALKISLWICIAAAFVCLSFGASADIKSVSSGLAECGIPDGKLTEALELYRNAFMRSGWFFAVSAFTFGMYLFGSLKSVSDSKWRGLWCTALAAVCVWDMTSIAAKFVHTVDCRFISSNQSDIMEDFAAAGGGADGSRFSYLMLTGGPVYQLPPSIQVLQHLGLTPGDPLAFSKPDEPSVRGFSVFGSTRADGGGALKIWQFMGTELILISPQQLMPLLREKLVSIVGTYSFDRSSGMFVRSSAPSSFDMIAVRPNSTAPSPAVFYLWDIVSNDDEAYAVMAGKDFDFRNRIVVQEDEKCADLHDGGAGGAPVRAEWTVRPTATHGLMGEIRAQSESPGLLFFRETILTRSPFEAFICIADGRPEKVVPLKANTKDWCLPVPAGNTRVLIKAKLPACSILYYVVWAVFSTAAFVLFILNTAKRNCSAEVS